MEHKNNTQGIGNSNNSFRTLKVINKNFKNYRGISLLSAVKKFTKTRLRSIVETPQNEFIKGHCINNHIFTLGQLIEGLLNTKEGSIYATQTFKKAFDKVNREYIWNALKKIGNR